MSSFISLDRQPSSMGPGGPPGGAGERGQEEAHCAVCLGRYEDPRILRCGHSFCRRCLVDVLEKRRRSDLVDHRNPLQAYELTCPKCRLVTMLKGGVDALPVNYELDSNDMTLFDDEPSFSPTSPAPMSSNFSSLATCNFDGMRCPEHNRALDFFCEPCDKLMCASCAFKHGCGNKVVEAKEMIEDLRTRYIEPLDTRYLRINVAVDEITRMITVLQSTCEQKKQKIHQMFDEIQNLLRARELTLIQSLDGIVRKKCVSLQEQCRSLVQMRDDLQAKKEKFTKSLTVKEENFRILQTHKNLLDELNQIVERADSQRRSPVEDITEGPECHLPGTLLQEANSFGEVYCTPWPERFLASGPGLERAFVGREAHFVVEAHDKYDHRAFKSGNLVIAEVRNPRGDLISTKVKDTGRGRYDVEYVPQCVGLHNVTVIVDGRYISNWSATPMVFNLRDYSAMMQPRISFSRQHISPDMSTVRGVCALSNGTIMFSDQLCLRTITKEGRLIRCIGKFSMGQSQFHMPVGLTATRQGHVFVADRQNHRVQKITEEGKFLMAYGNKTHSLSSPEDVAVVEDKLYVVDRGRNHIQVFNQKSGKLVESSNRLNLKDPQGIAYDEPRDRLFISDSGNNRILCITPDAKLIPEFGQNGEFPLSSPSGIAVDTDGFVLVTSAKEQVVTILTPQGLRVNQLGGGEGRIFGRPCGICVNESGSVVVADAAQPPSIHIL